MHRFAALVTVFLIIVVAGARVAEAQTCRSLPSIGENSMGNIGARLSFASQQQLGIDAGFTYGGQYAFGGFQYGKTNYTGFSYTATVAGFNLGGQLEFGKEKILAICPMFNLSDESASNLNASALSETVDIKTGGVSIGYVLVSGEQRQIVPSVDLFAGQLRDQLAIPGTKVTDRSNIGIVSLGVSLIINRRFSLRPAYTRQIGGAQATADFEFAGTAHGSFAVTAVFAYGHR
jgi:hypothetical protein